MSGSDLFLEQRFTTMDWKSEFSEVADQHLGDYLLPEQVEKLIESGKYKNVEQKITKVNYSTDKCMYRGTISVDVHNS